MTPEENTGRLFNTVVLQVVLISLLGYVVIGRDIFVPGHPVFAYLVLAVSLIGAFTLLMYRGREGFSMLVLVVTALLAATWFWNRSFAMTFRGLGRFWVIALLAVAGWRLLSLKVLAKTRVAGTIVWVLLGVALYAFMVAMDLFLFGFYPPSQISRWPEYLFDAVRLGAVLGVGMGLGYDLGRILPSRAGAGPSVHPPPPSSPVA